jgi:hypothetical protein
VAGRQGGGREINECYSETKDKLKLGKVTWRAEKGHLAPEVKTANEITCNYVWDKLYPLPISVTFSKWYIEARKGRPEKKQTDCVLMRRWVRGWQSREINLKN